MLPSSPGTPWWTHLEVGQEVREILLPTSGLIQGAQFRLRVQGGWWITLTTIPPPPSSDSISLLVEAGWVGMLLGRLTSSSTSPPSSTTCALASRDRAVIATKASWLVRGEGTPRSSSRLALLPGTELLLPPRLPGLLEEREPPAPPPGLPCFPPPDPTSCFLACPPVLSSLGAGRA